MRIYGLHTLLVLTATLSLAFASGANAQRSARPTFRIMMVADGESQMVFIELTEMEDQHARRLVDSFGDELQNAGVDAQAFLDAEQGRAEEVLDVREHEMLEATDMRNVIEHATQFELRARDAYRELQEKVEDDRLRKVCEELAEEEQRHRDMLANLRISVDTPIDERPALG